MKKAFGAKTIVLPTPVFIVGSYDENDRPNIMNAAWGGICSSDPPCVAVSIRPSRQTCANIRHHNAFTINLPSAAQVKAADYAGMVSGKEVNKFEKAGLTPVPAGKVHAPAVAEFPMTLECRVYQAHEIGVHTWFAGEILDVLVDESVLDSNGHIDVAAMAPMIFNPENAHYYRIGDRVAQAFSAGRAIG
jgi:flavin reductase (DIM6/NTAB) family NADH-FMN oxidoreductase RutF